MLHVIINKEAANVSLKTVVQDWGKHKNRIIETASKALAINTYMDGIYIALHYYYKQALLSFKLIISNILNQRILLIGNNPLTLLNFL